MTTLIATRTRFGCRATSTILKDANGAVKKIYNNRLNQPRKGTPTLSINGKEYSIDWTNAEKL